MPLASGSSLGSYTIVAPLGTGGMGEVYRAHDPRLGRDVALKVLPADMARDPSRLERFTREARAIAALNHPHIVTIYSTEEADGIRFLTMELVEGQPLDALIPANGMPLARFLELAVPLADALNAAHQKQITHRDLKPANVMVARDGRLKVLDFGLASAPSRHLGTDSLMTSPQVTTPGTIIGTMPYMSPEQVEGKQLDHRTDLFSLGVMFHEMLVGTRPFSGESSPQLMSAILRDTPSSTSDLRGDVPEPLSRLVARCLEKQPDDRVQTARDIYNELRHVQKQLESGPRPKPDRGSAPAAMNDSLWLAVLPFTTRGTDPDGVSLAAGLTEDITAGLALFPSLSVVALQSARSFKDSPLDVRQIAERLNARYVMGGIVRKSASGIRVTAQLIDARSGAQLWTETYNRGAGETDIYAVQDDITDRVVSTVADKNGVLARSMVQAIREIPIEQLSARQLVCRCWGAQLSPTASQHEAVRAALESVLTRQPDDAELWAHLSQCYVFEHSLFFNPRPEPLVRARRAARRAIELDPSNQEGWLSLGLACFHGRDEAGLLEAVDRVLRLNPRASSSVAWMGCLLTHTGAYDRGCQITERAMALNASHAGWYHFAPFNRAFGRGDFDEALKSARRVNIAGFQFMHIAIAAAAGHLGLSDEGAAAIEALHTVAPPLADEQNLREMIIRWYWEEEMIESLLEGLRRSKSPTPAADATPVRSRPRSSPAAVAPAERPPSSPAAAGGTWIAVIPFTSVATDEDARTLADGLTEDITAGLARFPYLSVVAEHSARQHKGTTADVRQIGNVLGARYLLDGGIRRGGTSIRITARLVDAESGAQLWSETYTREPQGNLLAIQDDVTDRVVATVADVHGVLLRSASVGVRGVPIEQLTPEGLRLRYWSYHRQHAPIEHGLLRDHFERLAEAQPAVAPFWAVLAHLCLHEYGFGFNVKPEPLRRARHAVDRALELDSLNQHAWEALAFTLFFEQDREGFAHAVDRVLALNPRNANATALMGILLVHAGELERGCALADRAIAINPDHPGWYHIARASADYALGQFESARRFAKRINMPQHLWAHALVAMASAQLGRAAESLAALETLLGLEPAFADEAAMAAAARRWKWLPEQSEQMVDGYRKAMVLRREAANARPPSDAATTPAAAGVALPREAQPFSTGVRPPGDARTGAIEMAVAVRPLIVRAGDDDAAELAEGLAERITTGLSRFPYLRVRAAPGADVPARQSAGAAGTTLGARFAVEGGVKRAGRAVRVNVRLLEIASDTTLWAEQYDRDGSGDAFTIQDEIGDRVVATLADDGGVLYRLFAAAVRATTDEEHDTLRLFVRFAEFVEHFTRETHSRLRDEYEALVERQPSNATAWAHLAVLYGLEVFFDFNPLPDAVARVRRAADRAVGIDSTNQGAWYALADAAFFERNAAAFRSAADRTIELNPLRSRTVGAIGLLRAFAGDPAEGAAIVTRAISLNPRHPGWFHLAPFLDAFQQGDADRALGEAARINMPHVPVDGRLFAIAAAGRFGRAQEAAAAIAELRRDYPYLLDGRRARDAWAIRIWSGELLDSLVDGFEAALNAQSAALPASARATGSSPATAAPLTRVTSPALTSDLAIAVRLFSSRGGESADALAEGLTDDVTAGLSRFSYLRVVPRAVGEATLPPARYVLEGQVRRAHPHLRISARLDDTVSGATLWAENFDRAADVDTFQLQDEIAPRIIATIADANGVLLRSMVTTLKQRPIEEHTVSDLIVRFNGFLEHFDPAEHAMIRDRLSAALLKEPGHADGWACLSSLIEHEVSHGLNPQPDSLKRARECAERSIAANPVCQEGWRATASAAFFARDAAGVRVAAERAIAINPLNTATVAVCGMFIGYSGAWDRGLEVVRHAMQPNPHYPGWLHFPFFSYHYIRREYAEALERVKQVNMPRFAKLHLSMAAVAGQLGLRDEARMALEALSRTAASSPDEGYARRSFTAWLWRQEDIDHHVEGVRKARALVAGETDV